MAVAVAGSGSTAPTREGRPCARASERAVCPQLSMKGEEGAGREEEERADAREGGGAGGREEAEEREFERGVEEREGGRGVGETVNTRTSAICTEVKQRGNEDV